MDETNKDFGISLSEYACFDFEAIKHIAQPSLGIFIK
jgi:hypothetical protein